MHVPAHVPRQPRAIAGRCDKGDGHECPRFESPPNSPMLINRDSPRLRRGFCGE